MALQLIDARLRLYSQFLIERRLKNLLILLLFTSFLQAQEAVPLVRGNFLTLGVGIPVNSSRDQANSVLAYKGRGWRFYIRTEDYRENYLFRFQFTSDNMTLRPKVRPRQDIRRTSSLADMHFSWGYYRRLGEAPPADGQQYVGLSYTLQVNRRKYQLPANNITSFLLQNGFAIGGVDRRSLGNGTDWALTTHLEIPVFSGVYRPTYIGLMPGGFQQKSGQFKDFLRHIEWGSFGVFTKIALTADFDYRAQPWRADRYSLDWNFFRTPLPKGKPLLSTSSSLSYGLNILL